MDKMLSKLIVYPKVESHSTTVQKQDGEAFEVIFIHSTWLRKKHTDGKWYLVLILTKSIYDKHEAKNITDVVESLNRFHTDVYQAIIKYEIPVQFPTGMPLAIIEDENQIDESERITNFV